MRDDFGKDLIVPAAKQRRFALYLGGRFWPLCAGVQNDGNTPLEESRLWHYFGGAVVRRPQARSMAHTFSMTRVLGNAAQGALMTALEENTGEAVDFLCWNGPVPSAEAEQAGNGFKGRCVLTLTAESESGPGGAQRIRFSLNEVSARQRGTVRLEQDGTASFSPLGGGQGVR